MKKIILLIILTIICANVYAQDATVIYKNTANSTVTIETDNGLGSGFFVGENIIATNYHVIEGATTAYCYTNNSTTKYKIEGYLAADKSVDLILLKVIGLTSPSIKLATATVTPGQKVYVLGSPKGLPATISDGIVSGLRDFEGYKLIQITAPISPGSSGGPVLNSSGELIGISVGQFANGQNLNFAIPKTNLELLLSFKKTYALPITSLYNTKKKSPENETNYYGKDKIFNIGIFKRGTPGLSLDYLANIKGNSVFFFTYEHESDEQRYQTIWLEDYRLVDLETGEIYYFNGSDLPKKDDPRIIYNGTKTRFCVFFDRLPPSVKNFSLMEGECSETSFCFLNIDLSDYYETSDWDSKLYINTDEEGTVAFYTAYDLKGGEISIYIEGYYVGKLTKFFKDKTATPQCGQEGTLTIRLEAGTYNYTASNNKFNWKGQITITKNGCFRQGLKD
ncbi:MAG TPA: S1C family serine protease [Bacteroidales bacterium]|nr:S1C family serine protease [Bacteroidales bacterium]